MTWSLRRTIAVALVGLAATAFTVTGLSRLAVNADVASFLPRNDPATTDLQDITATFGGDPVVVVLKSNKPGELLNGDKLPALLGLEGQLSAIDDVAVAYGPATTLNQTAIQIQDLLASVSGYRDGLKEADDPSKLAAFEKRYGALVVKGMPAGLPTLRNQQFVTTVVFGSDGQPRSNWRHLVPDQSTVAILIRPREGIAPEALSNLVDKVKAVVRTQNDELGASSVTVTGAPVLTSNLATQVRREMPILGGAAFAVAALCLILVPWRRRKLARLAPLVTMVAAVALTLATLGWRGEPISLSAVAFLPVMLGLGTYYPVYLAQRGHRRVVLSVAVAASAAFATLMISPLPFVRDLGLAVALGIGFVVAIATASSALRTRSDDVPAAGRWAHVRIPNAPLPVIAVAVAAAVVGWTMLLGLRIDTDPHSLLEGVDGYSDATAIENQLGYSGELDIVLDGPNVLSPASLAWLRKAEQTVIVNHAGLVRPIASPDELLGFLGPEPTQDQINAALNLLPTYLSGAVVNVDRTRAIIALGVGFDDFREQRDLVATIRDELSAPPPGYEMRLVGIPVTAARGYDLVSRDRHLANLVGIGAAGLVLAIGLRRRTEALRAAAGALLATGWGFALLRLTDGSLNPVTLAFGSLTAAVGCELAVVLSTVRRTGDVRLLRSLALAALLSVGGYGVLGLSGLAVIRDLSHVLVVSVLLALAAAWISSTVRTTKPRQAAAPVSTAVDAPVGRTDELAEVRS